MFAAQATPFDFEAFNRAFATLAATRALLWLVAALTALAGMVAANADLPVLHRFGFSTLSVLEGGFYVLLGYYVGERSRMALALALALLLFDSALLGYATGTLVDPFVASLLVFRFMVIGLLVRGFPAMKKLDTAHVMPTMESAVVFPVRGPSDSVATDATLQAAAPVPDPAPASTQPEVVAPTEAAAPIFANVVDANGMINCPKCQYRQYHARACLYCGIAFDHYWSARRRVLELESKLGRSWQRT